jgi:hypothetical protein
MATFQNTVTIARPADEVFAFLADFGNIPAWNYAIACTVQTSPGPAGVGATYLASVQSETPAQVAEMRTLPARISQSVAQTARRSNRPVYPGSAFLWQSRVLRRRFVGGGLCERPIYTIAWTFGLGFTHHGRVSALNTAAFSPSLPAEIVEIE